MWICTNKGFISVVAHWDDKNKLLVRARRKECLNYLFPDTEITETPNADYRFRITQDKETFKTTLNKEIDNIDYTNFKNSVMDNDLHDAYFSIWSIMHDFQIKMVSKLKKHIT